MSVIHSADLLRLSNDLPIVVEVVETRDKIDAVLPALDAMLQKDNVTVNGVLELRVDQSKLVDRIIKRFADSNEMTDEAVSSTHGQYGLVKLLQKLKTRHCDVKELGFVAAPLKTRERILNTVMLPAEDSENSLLVTGKQEKLQ